MGTKPPKSAFQYFLWVRREAFYSKISIMKKRHRKDILVCFFGFPFFLRRFLIALAHMIWDLTLFYMFILGSFNFHFLDFPRKTMGTKEAFSEYFLASIFYLDQCEGHTFSKIYDFTFFPSAFDHISIFHF